MRLKIWNTKYKQWLQGAALIDGQVWSTSNNMLVDNMTDEVIVCQSTGKIDKTDIEIWEGDVVKFGKGGEEKFIITKHDGAFYAISEEGKTMDSKVKVAPYFWEDNSTGGVLIIGNIYESKALANER